MSLSCTLWAVSSAACTRLSTSCLFGPLLLLRREEDGSRISDFPCTGVSLYVIVLDKLFQVLICLGEACNFDLCELLEHLLKEPHGCLLKQEEATVLELKNIRRGIRCGAILCWCRVFSRTASSGILAGHVLWLHRQGARRHLEQTLQ